jgi:hypothetical protein
LSDEFEQLAYAGGTERMTHRTVLSIVKQDQCSSKSSLNWQGRDGRNDLPLRFPCQLRTTRRHLRMCRVRADTRAALRERSVRDARLSNSTYCGPRASE